MIIRLSLLSLALTGISLAGELYTGPFGPGGTWNLYQFSDYSVTWNDAKLMAEQLKAPAGNPEISGHLVTLSSIAESLIIVSELPDIAKRTAGGKDQRSKIEIHHDSTF